MTEQRWWHVAVIGIGVLLSVLALLNAVVPAGAIASAGVIVAGWFLLGRLQGAVARYSYAALLVLASGVGTAFDPAFATVQCVAYPLVWTLTEGRTRGILGSVAVALAVGIGTVVSTGSLVQALAVQGVSLALSIGLGLWITSIAQQSHERKRLLDELRSTQEKLSAMNRDAGMTSERERLAREIHDTIAQDLTGIVMLSQRAQRELATGGAAVETLGLLEESARTALAETRALVASGAPVALANGGIADALRRLGERFERETAVTVAVRVDLGAIDRDSEVVLLRCAQEGLAYVRKHANASAVTLDAWSNAGAAGVRIADDGDGFDPDSASDGFGLSGMRERLALVGGTLDVSSSPAGTVLTATLPVAA